jgi:NCS1 family nucleobase:cation symporter-1
LNQAVESTQARSGALEVELHGIDYIPASDRHGKPNTLFTLWFASNVEIVALVTGALVVVLGLNLVWAIFAILIGNGLGGLYMAFHSVQGPRLGVPQMIQSRAQFGMFGAILPLVVVVVMYIGYFVANAVVGGQAVAILLHVTTPVGIIIANAVTVIGVWVGYNFIHTYTRVMSVVALAPFIALLVALATQMPAHQPSMTVSHGTIMVAIEILVSWQLTWAPYVSDYSRYLPESTSSRRIFWYTYLGSVIGTSFVMIIGALAAVVAKAQIENNAPAYLAGLFPAVKWLFLLIFVLGLFSGSLEDLYGAFLTSFACLSPSGRISQGWRARVVTTTVVAIIGTVIAIWASPRFLADLANFALFSLYALIPWTAINLTDFYLVHHGRYDVREFFKVDGRWGRVNWRTIVIFLATVAVEIPFMNSPWFEGPVAKLMDGADLSWIIGFFFAAAAYYLSVRFTRLHRIVEQELDEIRAAGMSPTIGHGCPETQVA